MPSTTVLSFDSVYSQETMSHYVCKKHAPVSLRNISKIDVSEQQDEEASLVLHVTTFRRRLTPEMHSPNTAYIRHCKCFHFFPYNVQVFRKLHFFSPVLPATKAYIAKPETSTCVIACVVYTIFSLCRVVQILTIRFVDNKVGLHHPYLT